MALTKTITLKSATKTMEKQYNITVTLSLLSDGKEVLTRDFSFDFKPDLELKAGDNVKIKQAMLIKEIQSAIDNYKTEQALLNNETFGLLCTNIEKGLIL